jgi:hypothetical protein
LASIGLFNGIPVDRHGRTTIQALLEQETVEIQPTLNNRRATSQSESAFNLLSLLWSKFWRWFCEYRSKLADLQLMKLKPVATFSSDDEDHPTLLTEIGPKPFLTTRL